MGIFSKRNKTQVNVQSPRLTVRGPSECMNRMQGHPEIIARDCEYLKRLPLGELR